LKHKTSGYLSATIVITAALSGLSSAAIIGGSGVAGYSYTNAINLGSAEVFNFKQFDSSLGTLTNVNLVLTLSDWSGAFTFEHPGSLTIGQDSLAGVRATLSYANETLRTTASQNLTPDGDLTFASAGTNSITPAGTVSASQNASRDGAWAALNGFVGTGDISLSYASVQTSTLADTVGSYSLTPSMSGNLTAYVTYTYEVAAVPEPSEFLLAGVPALLGGLVLSRRRAVRKKV